VTATDRRREVMVVDDSAVVRQLLTTLLEREGDLVVTTAADPLIARTKMDRRQPDVLLLDIEMPRMNGLRFLREIMTERPMPVVICSSHVAQGTRQALEAMALGAIDVIVKPEVGVREFLEESRITISDVVRAAACTKVHARERSSDPVRPLLPRPPRVVAPRPAGPAIGEQEPMIAIGASTGGPGALARILGALDGEVPPILIVQHLPKTFTASFANNLGRTARIEVREAVDGDPLQKGLALVAPGGQHMVIARHRRELCVRILDGPLVSRHRPSVDMLFTSVAEHAHRDSLGVILTGMGSDGVEGLLLMRDAGMPTIAQDRASCAVFGMPREAIAREAAAQELTLDEIATAIQARATAEATPANETTKPRSVRPPKVTGARRRRPGPGNPEP
jgi:two-component system chemotaxis response regulator CheB